MRRRSGRRRSTRGRTFGGSVLALSVGALAIIIAWVVRRRGEAADAVRESYGTARERFEETRQQQTKYATDLSERVTGELRAGAESVRAASQELTEQAQERGQEAGEEAERGSEEDEVRSIIRESVRRSRREAQRVFSREGAYCVW